jgi:hypothetical protein
MDGKFLTKKTSNLVAELIFNALLKKLKWWMKPIARKLIKLVISFICKGADKIIPDSVDPLINLAINQSNNKDWDGAIDSLAKVENILIDIPGIDEKQEYKIFHSTTYAGVQNLKGWIENKKHE